MIDIFTLYLYMGLFDLAILIFIFYWEFIRNKGKIQVRVKTPLGERRFWKKPEKDGKTIKMENPRRHKKPGWEFTFTNEAIYWISRWGGLRHSRALDVFYDSPTAITWKYDLESVDQPKWNKRTSKEFIEAEILKQRGQGLKTQLPTLFWLILIIGIINLILTFLSLRSGGGIKF